MNQILIPVALGELIDKITILEIKAERITDTGKLINVKRELEQLNNSDALDDSLLSDIADLRARLKAVNSALWDIEDKIRVKESQAEFDDEFIELARSVYITNDERAACKRSISLRQGSDLVEEKSYADYQRSED